MARGNNLIYKINRKDMAAWEILYQNFYQALCSYVYTIVKDQILSEDIVQETFIKLWESEKKFTNTEEFTRYLYRANYNNALNYLRNKNIHKIILNRIGSESEYMIPEDALFADTVREELLRRLYFYLQELPKERKEIMLLSISGLSNTGIADKLGISVSTVKNQKNKSLKYLRCRVKDIFLLFLLGL